MNRRQLLALSLGTVALTACSDKADALCDRILAGANTKGLDTLKWMDSRAVADLIRYEHPQIQTIVLAYLDVDQSADVLSQFPDKVRLPAANPGAPRKSCDPSRRKYIY